LSTTSLATLDPVEPFDPIVERLSRLHPKVIDLTLDRLLRLLDRLGCPQEKLPPVIHVAGTNGKGSTVAFLRAILEAAGYRAHVLTSPHLIHFCERIRLAGSLIEEAALVDLLEECEAANGDAPITFFEMATAAALLAFSRTPADFLLLEVGLGGRYDATNVVNRPAASVITPVSIDHKEFLGDTIAKIAGEKAGIIKSGCPVVVGPQTPEAMSVIKEEAAALGAPMTVAGKDWTVLPAEGNSFRYRSARADWSLPPPSLVGRHQFWNAATALAALEATGCANIDRESAAQGVQSAQWPARLQRSAPDGGLARLAAPAGPVWIDGAHNPAAAEALAEEIARWPQRPVLIAGVLSNKDYHALVRILAPHVAALLAVPVPRSKSGLAPEALAEAAREAGLEADHFANLQAALRAIAARGAETPALVAGSLYLAGEALRLDRREN
jgi:dihydrofolate synthase / folylpolyglutamate synthase